MLGGSIIVNTKAAYNVEAWRTYLKNNPLSIRYRLLNPQERDISAYLTDYERYKTISVGDGDIVFENEHKNAVPSTISYVKKKG